MSKIEEQIIEVKANKKHFLARKDELMKLVEGYRQQFDGLSSEYKVLRLCMLILVESVFVDIAKCVCWHRLELM